MAEMRGCDLVVEYLVSEQVPYLFGYAGHGAVGLLDGVYDRQDELKVIFPRIESGAGYMADAYFRGQPPDHSRLHLDRARADAAHGRDVERVLRLVRVHCDHRPGGHLAVRLGRAAGGVSALPGRLPEHREGDHEAKLPGALRRRPRQVPAEGVQAGADRPAGPRAHRRAVRPLGDEGRRGGAGAVGALGDAPLAHSGLAGGRRQGARHAAGGAAAARPRRRRRRALRGERSAGRLRGVRQRPRLHDLHGQGRAAAPTTRCTSASPAAGASTRRRRPRATPTSSSRSAAASRTSTGRRGCPATPTTSRRRS